MSSWSGTFWQFWWFLCRPELPFFAGRDSSGTGGVEVPLRLLCTGAVCWKVATYHHLQLHLRLLLQVCCLLARQRLATQLHKHWYTKSEHKIFFTKYRIRTVHYREKYTPQGPRDFARAGILHPEARGQSRGPRYNQCNAMHHIAMWWHFACLQMSTLYLSTSFSAQGCVPDICPRECIKNTVPSTLPREQGVYWILWSLKIMTYNRSSMLPVNTKKYIPTVQWILTVLKSKLPL